MSFHDWINRPDNFPHPKRQCIYSVNGTLHNPICKVVFLDKEEAVLWKGQHIDSFIESGEWFLTPAEALSNKKTKLKSAKEELDKVNENLKKK